MGRVRAGILAAVTVLLSGADAPAQDGPGAMDRAVVARAIDARLRGMSTAWVVVAEEAPDDHARLLDGMVTDMLTLPNEVAAGLAGMQRLASYRRALAAFVPAAPDAQLHAALQAHLDLLRAIRDVDPHACVMAITGEPVALPEQPEDVIVRLSDAEAVASMRAAFAGRRARDEGRQPPGDADWAEVVRVWLTVPANRDYVDVMDGMLVEDPRYCEAVLSWFDAIFATDGEAGERARASTVQAIMTD